MALRVEHEIHQRRLGRNVGLGLVLGGLVAITFGLTVVKVTNLGQAGAFGANGQAASEMPGGPAAGDAMEGGG